MRVPGEYFEESLSTAGSRYFATKKKAPCTQPIYELSRESANSEVTVGQAITEFASRSVGRSAIATVCELWRAPVNRPALWRHKAESAVR